VSHWPAPVAILLSLVTGCGGEDADSAGGTGSAVTARVERNRVRVTYPTPYKIGDMTKFGRNAGDNWAGPRKAQPYDSYRVIFRGPGGVHCRADRARDYGFLVPKNLTATRSDSFGRPRCPGRFRGIVALRQPERPRVQQERLGSFEFTVAATP
jgi:hypothetical protein